MPLITSYTNYSSPSSSDVLPIVDVGTSTTMKVTVANLLAAASPSLAVASVTSSDPNPAVVATFYPVDASGGNVTITLPNAPADKSVIGVKMIKQASTNTVTINRNGSGTDVFNAASGATSLTLSLLMQGVTLQYHSGIWYVQGDDLPLGQLDERYGATVGSATWSGSTATVSAATAQIWNITLGNASTAVTLTAAPFASTVAQAITLYLSQPASGGTYNYSATWPGSVTWFGGTAPPIATGASALTVVTFESINGGTGWYGAVISNAALPLPVADGGTGLVALSPYQALVGGTSSTSPVQQQAITGKPVVAYATTGVLTPSAATYSTGVLSGASHAALGTIDGQTPAVNDRVLVKNEATAANNGIYTVTSLGSGSTYWTMARASDMTDPSQVPGAIVTVQNGTANAGLTYVVANEGPFTFTSTAISWTELGGAAAASSYLVAPTNYAPGTQANPAVSTTSLAAFDSTNLTTGSFTAPASGTVVVTFAASLLFSSSSAQLSLAWSSTHGGTTVIGDVAGFVSGTTTGDIQYNRPFVISGLTSGTSYQFDLLGAASTGNVSVRCVGTATAGTNAAPAVITVQAV